MIAEKQLYNLIIRNKNLNLTFLDKIKDISDIPHGKFSSVLVIIHYTRGIPFVILTKRSNNMKRHAGEISFPGGKYSIGDKSIVDTAIRETFEEIGLKVKKEKIIGCLPPTNTFTTKILIFPFIVIEEKISEPLIPNEEVEKIIDIPLQRLKESLSIDFKNSSRDLKMYKFPLNEYIIWGATARILKDFLDIL